MSASSAVNGQGNTAWSDSLVDVQVDAGLDALKASLEAGFEQFGKVRSDPNLDALRKSPRFDPLVDEYDEPVISSGAIKCAPLQSVARCALRSPEAAVTDMSMMLGATGL